MHTELKFYMETWVFIDDVYCKSDDDRNMGFHLKWLLPYEVGQNLSLGDGWVWKWEDTFAYGTIDNTEDEWREYDHETNSFTINGGYYGCNKENFKKLFMLAKDHGMFNHMNETEIQKYQYKLNETVLI